jgi:flagellin-like protein
VSLHKAISSTLTTVILIAVTLACAAIVAYMFSTVPSQPPQNIPKTLISIVKISIESDELYAYVYNYGSTSVSVKEAYVDGNPVSFQVKTLDGVLTGTLSPSTMYKILVGSSSLKITKEMDIVLDTGDVIRYQVGK